MVFAGVQVYIIICKCLSFSVSQSNCQKKDQTTQGFALRSQARSHQSTKPLGQRHRTEDFVGGWQFSLKHWNIYRKVPYLMGKPMVSGSDFPLNQSIDRPQFRPMVFVAILMV